MTDEDDLLAGELALGLLDGDERAAALRRVIADPAFARAVERWRDRFALLHGEWPEVQPGPKADANAARIPSSIAAARGAGRWVAVVAGLAAAMLLAVIVTRPTPTRVAPAPPSRAPLLVAVLAPSGGEPVGAVYDPLGRDVRLTGTVPTPTGRALELWAIGGDGVPHAAGLVPPGEPGRIAIPPATAIGAGITLALSIEPPGGSPKPTPTGPVIATGKLVAL